MVQEFWPESILALDSAPAPIPTSVPDTSTCTNIVCGLGAPAFWMVFVVFNVAAVMLLLIACKAIDFRSALLEKSTQTALPSPPPAPAAPVQPGTPPAPQSSSRFISALGGLLMTAFFCACCNVHVYRAFADPNDVKPFAQGVWPLFLAGSALFLRYAFNQLTGVFASQDGTHRIRFSHGRRTSGLPSALRRDRREAALPQIVQHNR